MTVLDVGKQNYFQLHPKDWNFHIPNTTDASCDDHHARNKEACRHLTTQVTEIWKLLKIFNETQAFCRGCGLKDAHLWQYTHMQSSHLILLLFLLLLLFPLLLPLFLVLFPLLFLLFLLLLKPLSCYTEVIAFLKIPEGIFYKNNINILHCKSMHTLI